MASVTKRLARQVAAYNMFLKPKTSSSQKVIQL